MTAELLRSAAALMRVRAEAATEGPWVAERPWMDRECGKCDGATSQHEWHADAAFIHNSAHVVIDEWHVANRDAPHVASWHPVVALAVADWLEATADDLSADDQHDGWHHTVYTAALAVANAYLNAL